VSTRGPLQGLRPTRNCGCCVALYTALLAVQAQAEYFACKASRSAPDTRPSGELSPDRMSEVRASLCRWRNTQFYIRTGHVPNNDSSYQSLHWMKHAEQRKVGDHPSNFASLKQLFLAMSWGCGVVAHKPHYNLGGKSLVAEFINLKQTTNFSSAAHPFSRPDLTEVQLQIQNDKLLGPTSANARATVVAYSSAQYIRTTCWMGRQR